LTLPHPLPIITSRVWGSSSVWQSAAFAMRRSGVRSPSAPPKDSTTYGYLPGSLFRFGTLSRDTLLSKHCQSGLCRVAAVPRVGRGGLILFGHALAFGKTDLLGKLCPCSLCHGVPRRFTIDKRPRRGYCAATSPDSRRPPEPHNPRHLDVRQPSCDWPTRTARVSPAASDGGVVSLSERPPVSESNV
jgi:hypothetical protein